MSAPTEGGFQLDCENTQRDNDRVLKDLRSSLTRDFSFENRDRYGPSSKLCQPTWVTQTT